MKLNFSFEDLNEATFQTENLGQKFKRMILVEKNALGFHDCIIYTF